MSASWTRPLDSRARALGAVPFVLAAALAPISLSAQALDWTRQCRLPLKTPDSSNVVEYLAIRFAREAPGDRARMRSNDGQRSLALTLQEIASLLAPPRVIELPDDGTTAYTAVAPPEGPMLLVPRATGRVEFTLARDGRIGAITPRVHSEWPQADSLLTQALVKGSTLGTLSMVDVSGALFAKRDTIRLALDLTWSPDSQSVRRPVARVRLPVYLGESARHSDGNHFPDFPAGRVESGKGGDVALEYDVDTNGDVDANSVEVTGSPPEDLRDASLGAVRAWHFSPARVGGCRVRTHLRQVFKYRVEP